MDTMELILPILERTYGKSTWTDGLAEALVKRIDADEWDTRGREYSIMLVCWDWMTGGTTAASVAAEIEEVLNEVPSGVDN